jgi:hypothetical protein
MRIDECGMKKLRIRKRGHKLEGEERKKTTHDCSLLLRMINQ